MKLRSIALTNVRRFVDPVRIDGIADGVNVLSAPNEFGKSTVFDALHALFFVPHGSRKRDISELQPHAGGAPEIAVELETPDGRFRVSKRWMTKPEARVEQDGRLVAQADAAEAWITRLLGDGTEGAAGGPSGLLWVRQGLLGLEDGDRKEQSAALAARRDLLSSVTGEVEAMTGGRRMDAALRRCREEIGAYATATGRPKAGGPWAEAEAEVAALSEEHDGLEDRVRRLQDALDERTRLRRELAGLEDPERAAERRARLEAAQRAQAAADAHLADVAASEQAVQTARLVAERAQGALAAARAARKALADAEAADRAAEARQAEAAARLDEAERALAAAGTRVEAAETARRSAETQLRRVQAAEAAAAARARRADLADRLAAAQATRDRLEAAQAAAAVGPDDRDIARLRDLATALSTARALRDSTATRVTMRHAEGRAGGVLRDGTPLEDGVALTIHAETALELAGLGVLIVHPGAAREDEADVARAEARLADALATLGAETPEAALSAHETRKRAETERDQLKAELRLRAPDGIEQLRAQLAALPPEVEEAAGPAAPEDSPPLRPDAAEAALAEAQDRAAEALARRDAHREARDAARTAHVEARVRREEAARRRTDAEAALARLGATDEAALAAAAEAAARALETAEARRAEIRAAAPDTDAAQAALARARSIEEAARARTAELRPALAALDERIRGAAGEAVEERLRETAELRGAAEARRDRILREVAVLRRLQAALEAARSEARDRYFAPVAAELRPLLHLLWPEAELHWADDTLLPHALTRNGQEEPISILSGGTQEQIALLVRLAFARLLARDGRHAPVILDDALVFTDDDRIERMFDALHRQGGDLQILVLSCRQRAFRDLGGKTLRIASVASA